MTLDSDITGMNLLQLQAALQSARVAVRVHMYEKWHERCWVSDSILYDAVLPEGDQADYHLPPEPEWEENCKPFCSAYWKNRQPEWCKSGGNSCSTSLDTPPSPGAGG